jgi:pSer/pThr/pTyr-binding forkhead associated (FHA) protein
MEHNLYILVGKDEGKSFRLMPGKLYIVGRHSTNDIKILDENVSRNHFEIQVRGDRYFIMDMGSKNGTFVGGKELIPGVETEVKEGVPIVIGMTVLGLGDIARRSLKPFLDSAGFSVGANEYEKTVRPERVMAVERNLEFIYKMNNALMEAKDIREVLEKLLDNVFNLFKRIDRCVIIIIDNQAGKLSDIIYRSRQPVDDPHKIYNKELVEKALTMNKPVMIKDSDISEDEDDKITESLQLMKIKSAMCVPIASRHIRRGVIYVDSLEFANGFRESDVALLNNISGRAALAMDNLPQQTS